MATTPNYGWVMPDPTDFVTDLPADFEIFGDAVDATVDGIETIANAAQPNVITTEGDLVIGDASGDPVRLPIGALGTVLTSDGDTAEWATPTGGGLTWALLNAGGTALTGAATVTVSGIGGYDNYFIKVEGASSANAGASIGVRINADTGNNYASTDVMLQIDNTFDPLGILTGAFNPDDFIRLGRMANNASGVLSGHCQISGGLSTGVKMYQYAGTGNRVGSTVTHRAHFGGGNYNASAAITSISITSNSGDLDAGTVFIYGA